MKKDFDFVDCLSKLVPYYIGLLFLVAAAIGIFWGVTAHKAYKEIKSVGLKPAIERIWEGPK